MATADLLAVVLTLLGVLVQGQEAPRAQELQVETDKLTEVGEVIIEDELNSDIDFLMLGSANTRAECIQGKKCKNKGGTCQRKGNSCPGKIKKGCSKGCSCCVPEKITCKPSRRCKRENGACIARKDCNGKIISKGCKKPTNCKRTHVCCVQDESTTKAPTCSGGLRCQGEGVCPDTSQFPATYVCEKPIDGKNCITMQDANNFMNRIGGPALSANSPYVIFAKETFAGNAISYTSTGTDTCKITNDVQTWTCTWKKGKWSCTPNGFCTANIKKVGGVYKPDASTTSLKCTCPNSFFDNKHVCATCNDKAGALAHVNRVDSSGNLLLPPTNGKQRTIFSGKLTYQDYLQGSVKQCLVSNPTVVMSWLCIPKTSSKWDKCVDIGMCTDIRSKKADGHLEYTYTACYQKQPNKIWADKDCPTVGTPGIVTPDITASCMVACKATTGCNAFNFKSSTGALCTLKNCPGAPSKYPTPVASTSGFNAYYQDVVI